MRNCSMNFRICERVSFLLPRSLFTTGPAGGCAGGGTVRSLSLDASKVGRMHRLQHI